MNYRSWLRKNPAPAAVQIGEKKIKITESRTKWADIEESIYAIAKEGDAIIALDADNEVLRSVVYDPDKADEEEPEPTRTTTEANADFMVALARELNAAYRSGAEMHAAAYALGFNKLVEIVEMSVKRTTALESMWAKAMTGMIRAQSEAAMAQIEAEAQVQNAAGPMGTLAPILESLGPTIANKLNPPSGGQPKE